MGSGNVLFAHTSDAMIHISDAVKLGSMHLSGGNSSSSHGCMEIYL